MFCVRLHIVVFFNLLNDQNLHLCRKPGFLIARICRLSQLHTASCPVGIIGSFTGLYLSELEGTHFSDWVQKAWDFAIARCVHPHCLVCYVLLIANVNQDCTVTGLRPSELQKNTSETWLRYSIGTLRLLTGWGRIRKPIVSGPLCCPSPVTGRVKLIV